MKRRLALACAFIGRPKVILLDEPLTGLDGFSRDHLLNSISRHRKTNKAFLAMISHYPKEISHHVQQFLVFRKQQAPHWLEPEQLRELTELKHVEFNSNESLSFPQAKSTSVEHNRYFITTKDSDQTLKRLHSQTQNYKNLEIKAIDLNTIFEEHL